MGDVKGHRWFAGVVWDDLRSKRCPAPWIPEIKNSMDCSNFDPYEEDDAVPKYRGDQKIFARF